MDKDYDVFQADTEDLLGRSDLFLHIDFLIDNMEKYSSPKESLAIAISSPWGTGKSIFINKWKKHADLCNEGKVSKDIIISYNAWTDDDSDNPLSSIICSTCTQLVENSPEHLKSEFVKSSIGLMFYVAKRGAEFFLNQDSGSIDKIISEICESATGQNALSNPYFDEYNAYVKAKKDFKDALSRLTLTPDDTLANNEYRSGRLIFVIDELDRCRPTYAIEVLETIKHFMNIPNTVFLFAVDLEQLGHSISGIYGQNMDSNGYLRRFFDIILKLPTPSIDDFVVYLAKQWEFSEPNVLDKCIFFFTRYKLSLRDMEKVLKVIMQFSNTVLKDAISETKEIYIYLIILKYKFPNIYQIVLHEDFTDSHVSDPSKTELPAMFYSDFGSKYLNNERNRVECIEKALEVISQFNNVIISANQAIYERLTGAHLLIDHADYELISQRFTLGQYIERKLEMFEL